MMGKTRIEELCYELYGSSKQHDSWQRYAMVRELRELMKRPKASGSDHFERSGDEEQLPVMDDETDLLGTRTIVDPKVEIHESLVHEAILEEESMPQFQVPVSDLEHGLRIHNASSIVCEDSQYVVGCDELCDHQKSILQVSYVKEEVEELSQKSTSGNGEHVAHQLFDQKPVRVTHKEKHMKHLKAWKFKFKSTSKRSRLMDDKFSFGDATVLLNKEPQETIWDCVKKEFKETMAACGKNRVDRFKLAEEKESGLQVLDLNQTFMYHQIGHGVDILLAFKMLDHDTKMAVVLQRSTSLTTRDCPDRSYRANRVWKPGLEIYGCETKKQMLLSDKLANRVWERGKLLATHLYWELFGLRALIGVEIYSGKYKKQINIGHISLNGMCNKLVYDEEKKKLRHVGDDVKKGQNSFLGDVKSMSVQKRVLLQADETIIKTDLCQPHQLQDTTVSNWASDCVKQLQQSGNPIFQKVHETLWLTLPIPPTNQMKNVYTQIHMVLLLTPIAYAIHFLGGVGMDKKQSHLSLWINRVWDPGRSLVKDASYSTRIFSSLPATTPVSLLCQESLANQVTSFSTNLEDKVSLKREDLIQNQHSCVSHVRRKQARGHVDG